MDSVYGTKKYFQSLSGGCNAYKGPACRALASEYSYNNTFGRHSSIGGPYMHMHKQPSYSTDMSINSQYGYNTWGTINDIRNITPTLYNAKRRHKFRSFSIILTTAALIVLLAVLSIGALVFFFSGFKPNTDDSSMAFEGFFRIQKGDMYSSALRNNQSSIYRQKSDFYRRFIERSLSDNDVRINKLDIRGFGDGPLINVHFVVLLDVQDIPQSIHSIEDHIRNSLFLETNAVKSLYKFLKIEPNSVQIKRVSAENMDKYTFGLQRQEQTIQQTHFEKKLSKNGPRTTDKTGSKYTTTYQPSWPKNDGEPDVDLENAPSIQGSFEGSFEITKTDADITAKRTSPTKSFASITKQTTASIGMRPQHKKVRPEDGGPTTDLPTTTTPTTTASTTTTTTTTTATTTTTTTPIPPTIQIITISTTPLPTTNIELLEKKDSSSQILESNDRSPASVPPKLDMSLFTSAPVLDTKPWQPIPRPSSGPARPSGFRLPGMAHIEAIEAGLIPRNKLKATDQPTDSSTKPIFYQSFTNPVFMPGTAGIEKLGSTDVKPYPIPVPLIDDVVAPDVWPVLPMHKYTNDYTHVHSSENITESTSTQAPSTGLPQLNPPTDQLQSREDIVEQVETTINPEQNSGTTIYSELGGILLDLLQGPDNATNNYLAEERITEKQTEKPYFLNIKDMVLNKTKSNESSTEKIRTTTGTAIINDTMLYPTHTKWEYHDLSSTGQMNLKKTYNDTLQALIVENQGSINASLDQTGIKRNSSENIENITLIFNNLASKLGITSTFPTKQPPFSASSQQKLKQDPFLMNNLRRVSRPTTSSTSTITPSLATEDIVATSETSQLPILTAEHEPILGEAEVEVIDPTKYEEMLSSQSASSTTTSHPPTLVTLLPVRSNSGIRVIKPTSSTAGVEGRKFNSNLPTYREAVVTSGIQVTA